MTKARIKQTATTINVPRDFVRLEAVTKDGYYRYKIKYQADPVKAAKNRTFKVRLQFANKPFVRPQEKSFINFNAKAAIRSLQQRRASQKDLVKEQRSRFFLTYISDFTKKIPNDRANSLNRSIFTTRNIFQTKLRVKPALVADLNRENLSLPILDTNRNRLEESVQTFSGNQFKVAAANLIRGSRQDPAQLVGARTHSITSAFRSVAGTVPKQPTPIQSRLQSSRLLVGSLINQRKLINMSQLGQNAYINVLTREEVEYVEVEETINIPLGDLEEEEFFVIFQLKDNLGIIRQTINKRVPHSRLVAELEIPVVPPEVSALSVSPIGKVALDIKQLDENATSVNIYRRELNKESPTLDATYDFVGEADVEFGEGVRRVEDIFASTNPIIYRIVPKNTSGMLGAEFTSVVATQQRGNVAKTSPFYQRPKFVSLTYEIQETSLVITVRDVPSEPIAMRLLRRDKTVLQQEYTQIGDITLIGEDTNIPIIFEDNSVKRDRIYEYQVELIYKDGTTVFASNNLLIEYCPITSNIVRLDLSEPEVVQNGDEFDVRFTIEKQILQTEGDLIKTFLKEQGLLAEFQEQIISNRDTLQNLFAIRVTRTNVSTGELEDFGIIQSNDFSDQAAGRIKSVKPLQAGFDYIYNLTVHTRDPETVFSTLEKTIEPRTNVSYTFKPFEFKHPITLNRGNIVTSATLQKNYAKTTFTFGEVVDTQAVQVSLADVIPSLFDGKANQFGEDGVLVQWKVQGNVNKIDHFIVILEILSTRTIVGKSHNITNTNSFQFVDKLTNQECGELTYFIVPVFFDYSRGPELKTNQVLI